MVINNSFNYVRIGGYDYIDGGRLRFNSEVHRNGRMRLTVNI